MCREARWETSWQGQVCMFALPSVNSNYWPLPANILKMQPLLKVRRVLLNCRKTLFLLIFYKVKHKRFKWKLLKGRAWNVRILAVLLQCIWFKTLTCKLAQVLLCSNLISFLLGIFFLDSTWGDCCPLWVGNIALDYYKNQIWIKLWCL